MAIELKMMCTMKNADGGAGQVFVDVDTGDAGNEALFNAQTGGPAGRLELARLLSTPLGEFEVDGFYKVTIEPWED